MSMTTAGIRNFAALYVVGNCIALCSTGFLVGPKNQCKKMFDKTRRFSTIAYIVMLITVFACAMAVSTGGVERLGAWLGCGRQVDLTRQLINPLVHKPNRTHTHSHTPKKKNRA